METSLTFWDNKVSIDYSDISLSILLFSDPLSVMWHYEVRYVKCLWESLFKELSMEKRDDLLIKSQVQRKMEQWNGTPSG